jgi:hypothetical protein
MRPACEDAYATWKAALAELERSGNVRFEAEAYATKIKADLDDERTAILTDDVRPATAMPSSKR